METESRIQFTTEGEMGSYCLMDSEFLIEVMESSRNGQWYWLHSSKNVLDVYLRMVRMVHFMLYVFSHNKGI